MRLIILSSVKQLDDLKCQKSAINDRYEIRDNTYNYRHLFVHLLLNQPK